MGFPNTNRYSDLLNAIVDGQFYASSGYVIPYKLGLTSIRLETSYASTQFAVYINDKYVINVNSDTQGNVIFDQHLDRGNTEIRLMNLSNGVSITTWITVREYAIWLAAYAEELERIDDNIEDIRNNISIETATYEDVDNIYGALVNHYNMFGQDLSSYRNMLHELHLGYRNYGTRYRGIETAVAEITQIPPFGYARRMWGPNWVLDQSFLKNHRLKDRSHAINNMTGNITGVELVGVEPSVFNGSPAGTLTYDPVALTLAWSGDAQLVKNGEMFLPGSDYYDPAFLLGTPVEPYTITAGINDYLYMNIDDTGTIAIQLVTGLPNPTAANVAADINAALLADVRYVLYAGMASSYGSRVLLDCPWADDSRIHIEHGVQNAAVDVFGNRIGDISFDKDLLPGVTGKYIAGQVNLNAGVAAIKYEYDGSVTPVTRRLCWIAPSELFDGPWVTVDENKQYTLLSFVGHELVVDIVLDDMEDLVAPWPNVDLYTFSLGYEKLVSHIGQDQGLWVNVSLDDLPGGVVPIVDNIEVVDDATFLWPETPDYWWFDAPVLMLGFFEPSRVNNLKQESGDPSEAYRFGMFGFDAVTNLIGRVEMFPKPSPGPRGQSFPQRSFGGLYDYEEFTMIWSGWVNSGTVVDLTLTPSISFDDGAIWISGTPFTLLADPSMVEDPVYFSQESRIPADLTDSGVLVRLTIEDTLGGGTVAFLDGVSVDIRYITSRHLTRSTVPRTRHRQYHGELMWVWSPVELSLAQKEYLGLPHKAPSTNRPYAGVEIITVSEGNNAGIGTLEYEYNSVGDVKRLRWSTVDSVWGVGLGWIPITGDGDYYLYAPNLAYLEADITRSLLPTYPGTPPAVVKSVNITISDNTTDQGHSRWISPAHSAIDIFDVTMYNTLGEAINLKGASTETEFSNCTLENLEIVSADPFQYAYLEPTELPIEGETLLVSSVAPHVATLAYLSDQDQVAATLYENGVPVPNTDENGVPVWWFTSANQIRIAAGPPPPSFYFNPGSTYTIDYQLLYRVTTPVIDLSNLTGFGHFWFGHYPFGHPPRFDQFAWLIDHYTWLRLDSNQDGYPTTLPLFFNRDNGRAYLEKPSDMNRAETVLMSYSSDLGEQVAARYWRFLDSTTIEIDLSQLRSDAQYYLTHNELRVYEASPLTCTLEHRYADSEANCLLATWYEKERNEAVPMYDAALVTESPFHQLRLTVSGPVRDLRDFRVRSLVLKGLWTCLGAITPGLTSTWGV